MKKSYHYFVTFLFMATIFLAQAQEVRKPLEIQQLEQQKDSIVSAEKAALKIKVEAINIRLKKNEIDREKARQLKEEAAKLHALNIRNKVAIIDNQIALLEREDEDPSSYIAIWNDGKVLDVSINNKDKIDRYDKRTSSDIVIAFGFNNALQEGQSLDDSNFKIAGSRFFEIGWAWKTRVFKKTNWLRFKYGFSFQFNGLKPTDNRYFVEEGDKTVLQEFPTALDKSKFRMDNLVFPVFFEIGPSTKIASEKSVRFYTEDKIKIGIGGYAGFNIGERQKLKYEVDGENVKEKLKGGYNTNEFVYGLSGYLGWGGAALYVKYDLNPIFDAPNPEIHNISLGLRLDID